jgi:hypothetical protein
MPAYADDVTDSINEALKYYNEGKYSDAVGSLNYAAQLIGQKKGGQLEEFLPKPLDGWTAEDPGSQAAGAAMFGGGVTAERRYAKDSASVHVQIVTDSPLLQGMMMMFTNPMFAASDGGKLEKIKGQKAIVKYSDSDKEGKIDIVVANRFLITIEGNDVMKADLEGYAKAVDYDKLATLP